jgi:uncharacterized protein (DUF2141 family)
MNRITLFVSFVAVSSSCGAPATMNPPPTIKLPPGNGTLIIHVENAKTSKGPVLCDLFNGAENFPAASPIVGGSISLSASTKPLDCTFGNLPPGEYAMSVIQDENNNGTLDSNLFGAPTEGYGASNNILPATTAPLWADSKFSLGDKQVLELNVRLSNSGM